MLVQKMAVNADVGFLLAVVAFLSAGQTTPQLEVNHSEKEGGREGEGGVRYSNTCMCIHNVNLTEEISNLAIQNKFP